MLTLKSSTEVSSNRPQTAKPAQFTRMSIGPTLLQAYKKGLINKKVINENLTNVIQVETFQIITANLLQSVVDILSITGEIHREGQHLIVEKQMKVL